MPNLLTHAQDFFAKFVRLLLNIEYRYDTTHNDIYTLMIYHSFSSNTLCVILVVEPLLFFDKKIRSRRGGTRLKPAVSRLCGDTTCLPTGSRDR